MRETIFVQACKKMVSLWGTKEKPPHSLPALWKTPVLPDKHKSNLLQEVTTLPELSRRGYLWDRKDKGKPLVYIYVKVTLSFKVNVALFYQVNTIE